MRFVVNETAAGLVAPPKDICKVKDCTNGRFHKRGGNVFCKKHSGLRTQMSKKKFKELVGSNELVALEGDWNPKGKPMKAEVIRYGEKVTVNVTSKKKKARIARKEILNTK